MPPGVKHCSRCNFAAAPEYFKGSLCSMCAEPCAEFDVSTLHQFYDRHATKVRWRQRVMSLDQFYKERRATSGKGGRGYTPLPPVDETNFAIIHPVPRVKRGVKSARLS